MKELFTYNVVTFLITLNVSILTFILAIIAFCCRQYVLGIMALLNVYQSFIMIRILKFINNKEKRTSNGKE